MVRKFLTGGAALLLFAIAFFWFAGRGNLGAVDSARTEPAGGPRATADVAASSATQAEAAGAIGAPDDKQILFGDLHVHSTISGDAFFLNAPLMGRGGAMTPSDACDFARHCAALDFWSINDHASSISPQAWRDTITSIRACNAKAGDPDTPDTVAFLGWEWTQAGSTPDDHYGHKNVVLAGIDEDDIPTRPIAAKAEFNLPLQSASPILRGALGVLEPRFWDLSRRIVEEAGTPLCPDGHARDLPDDCRDVAPTPVELFRKLNEWGHDSIVIPHGTAWGIYTPPGSSWDKQLQGTMHDPDRQTMIEVYSGHGDSEVYRDWRGVEITDDGRLRCPEAQPNYLPICRRVGQVVKTRCLAAQESEDECDRRAALARQHSVDARTDAAEVVPELRGSELLDAGQCRDCRQPSFKYRPASTAQYIAAIGNFDDDPEAPRRFRLGFMASSDNHAARPGTGYKELKFMTDVGVDDPEKLSPTLRSFFSPTQNAQAAKPDAPAYSKPAERSQTSAFGLGAEGERVSSFQYTGGLVAVHATGRDRASIWSALKRNEMYGTSGPRMLLWFDLLTDGGPRPMGTEIELDTAPTFRVRAVGSFEQKPGCPAGVSDNLGRALFDRICVGECYFPSDERRPISRIELVRIRPQIHPDEDVATLIDDPWLSFDCDGTTDGCEATFTDPEFPASKRDAVYYARVFEPPIETVNGSPLNCEYDDEGNCIRIRPCDLLDECRAPDEPRAWSSPIYVDHSAARRSR